MLPDKAAMSSRDLGSIKHVQIWLAAHHCLSCLLPRHWYLSLHCGEATSLPFGTLLGIVELKCT